MSTSHSPWCVVVEHAVFSTSIAPLWKVVSAFEALPALVPELIASGTTQGNGVGITRTLHLHGGEVVREELIAIHAETFRFEYAIIDNANQPWEHYFCAGQLQALGADQTHLSATGFFQPKDGREAESRTALTGAYRALFAGYARALGVAMSASK